MRGLSHFRKSRRGAVAPMMAICLLTLILVSGGAVEYSNYHRARESLQKTVDAAALSAARHYHEHRDQEQARELVDRILQAGEMTGYELLPPHRLELSYRSDHHSSHAALTASAKGSTIFMRLAGIDDLTITVGSNAVKGGMKDVYLYLLLDVTGSMQKLIDAAGTAMLDFEAQLRLRLEQEGVDIGRLYVKAGYFRDLRIDKIPPAWAESPVYEMSAAGSSAALNLSIRSQYAANGDDLPESSPAAIAHALTTKMVPPTGEGPSPSLHKVQIIALWSDASGLPLGSEDIETFKAASAQRLNEAKGDDITVAQWKADQASNPLNPFEAMLDIMSEFTGVGGGAEIGCCQSMAQLRTEWQSRGATPLRDRYLALFVPVNEYPWKEMSRWDNVVLQNYDSKAESADGFIDSIVKAVLDSGMDLMIEPPPRM